MSSGVGTFLKTLVVCWCRHGGYDVHWLEIDFSLSPSLIIEVYVWWTHNGAYLQTALGSLCHVVFFSIRFDQAIIDLLIAFNYEVNGFSLPCKLAYLCWHAIKEVNKLDYWVHLHNYLLIFDAHMNKWRDSTRKPLCHVICTTSRHEDVNSDVWLWVFLLSSFFSSFTPFGVNIIILYSMQKVPQAQHAWRCTGATYPSFSCCCGSFQVKHTACFGAPDK